MRDLLLETEAFGEIGGMGSYSFASCVHGLDVWFGVWLYCCGAALGRYRM